LSPRREAKAALALNCGKRLRRGRLMVFPKRGCANGTDGHQLSTCPTNPDRHRLSAAENDRPAVLGPIGLREVGRVILANDAQAVTSVRFGVVTVVEG
jgi:hypothetical protein